MANRANVSRDSLPPTMDSAPPGLEPSRSANRARRATGTARSIRAHGLNPPNAVPSAGKSSLRSTAMESSRPSCPTFTVFFERCSALAELRHVVNTCWGRTSSRITKPSLHNLSIASVDTTSSAMAAASFAASSGDCIAALGLLGVFSAGVDAATAVLPSGAYPTAPSQAFHAAWSAGFRAVFGRSAHATVTSFRSSGSMPVEDAADASALPASFATPT